MDAISAVLSDENLISIERRLNEPMKNHTSFKIGGPVRAMFLPNSAQEMTMLCDALNRAEIKPLIVGNGTNLLVCDDELDMVIIKTQGMQDIAQTGECEITALSGVLLSKLAVFACERGLAGLEFAHGIPGTLGGAVSMNAGAYGGEIKDVVHSTRAWSAKLGEFEVVGNSHDFAYRHSCFSDTDDIILSSVIRLQKGDSESIRAQTEALNAKRRASQPLNMPSAGSTFKRPQDGYAAAMIEQAGLKGFTVGGAQVSTKHSGFVVNRGDATFADVLTVIEHVRNVVLGRFGVLLETEVKIISGRIEGGSV